MTPAAFFDMDRTLIRVNSGTLWIRWLRSRGEISLYETVRGLGWIAQYKLALLDMESVATKVIASMRGQAEEELVRKAREFFDGLIAGEVAPKALAAHLGIEYAICTRINVAGGRFDGTHQAPMCYGAGMVHWAEAFAREHDVDLAKSFFYTDSYTDLPMLERVGIARVVNPDTRLKRHAKRVGWQVDEW